MKLPLPNLFKFIVRASTLAFAWLGLGTLTAEVLLDESFDAEIPGWTAILPTGATLYDDGPPRWTFDPQSNAITESSNAFTDGKAFSTTAIASMLVNDAVTSGAFAFRADHHGFSASRNHRRHTVRRR